MNAVMTLFYMKIIGLHMHIQLLILIKYLKFTQPVSRIVQNVSSVYMLNITSHRF